MSMFGLLLQLENRYNDSTSFESLYQQYVHDWLPRPPATPEDFEKTFEEMNVSIRSCDR